MTKEVASWMGLYLKDTSKLGQLSIPGTHDSAAYKMNGFSVFATPWAKTQDWNITQQLEAGIRYFDLRVNDDMSMHHGIAWVGENLRFHLKEICSFLSQHPQDFVFVRLKAEQGDSNPNRFKANVEQIIQSENLKHYFVNNVNNNTLVKQVRGKIILINDSKADLRDLTNLNWRSIPKQDNYNISNEYQKWLLIYQDIISKNQLTNYRYQISVNHLSYTNNITALSSLAYSLNRRVYNYLREDFDDGKIDIKNLGIVVMDFPSAELINQIILRNITQNKEKTEISENKPAVNISEKPIEKEKNKDSQETISPKVKMDTPLPSSPVNVVGVNNAAGSSITGLATPLQEVVLRDGKGEKLATTKAKKDGTFEFKITQESTPYMTVVQKIDGQISDPTIVCVN